MYLTKILFLCEFSDEFGHFYIKPTKQKDKDQEIQRQVIDIVKNDVDLEPQPQVTLTFSSDDDLSRFVLNKLHCCHILPNFH